jgi:hypothetical protein
VEFDTGGADELPHGAYDLVISNPEGASAERAKALDLVAPPQPGAIQPAFVCQDRDEQFTIQGSGFTPGAPDVGVLDPGAALPSRHLEAVATESAIVVSVPAGTFPSLGVRGTSTVNLVVEDVAGCTFPSILQVRTGCVP